MPFKIIHRSPDGKRIRINITDVDLAIVNSIRRIILSEIPNVAIRTEDITIKKNTGALHNEFISHRLSLLPLCFSNEEIETFDAKKYKFILKKHNTTAESLAVTSQDIEIYDEQGNKYPPAFHARIFPANPITGEHILITKLRPNLYDPAHGEEIDFEFFAAKDIAQAHARWCPVSQCAFHNVIDMDEATKAFHAKVANLQLTKEQKDSMYQQFFTLEAFRHFKKNSYGEPCEFEFAIETECALSPEYMFGKAFEVLKSKLDVFIENIAEDKYPVKKLGVAEGFYEVEVKNETYTLLNVLQSCIYNSNMRQLKDTVLQYIGYYLPHPLDKVMVLKLKFIPEFDNLKIFLIENAEKIKTDIDDIFAEWSKVMGSSS